MSEQIRFEIPEDIEDENLADYIAENMGEYSVALDHSAYGHDERSQVDDISVTSVEIDDDFVTIRYDVDISAYHGCRDVNYAETDEREVTASREGRVLIFDKYVPLPPRSTYDEF